MLEGILPVIVIVALALFASVKILPEYERAVIFRLGRLSKALIGGNGPGLIIIIPGVDRAVRVDMRVITMDVPTQEVITKDNVPVKVNAVIYFRVVDPQNAIVDVENFIAATSQISQTTLRSVLGESEMDELLSQREKINLKLQEIIDKHTDPWGIKVSTVEVKDVELPQEMKRAMAKQAEAERERRAKIISAEGEFQASQKLADAAKVMSADPIAIQLRYLQTLTEIATENNSTTLFPIPIDLLTPFLKRGDKS
ncbi:MAG TPA: slipin family protein [bacterium]|nr:MAG: FtsH protease regulator HflK [bacterium ADurb.Bin236]HOC91015.1 slipin family protein [bacterium]HPI75174.1 slipin family protein [bacterium]HPN94658.1 slipin family protein [bacterium]